MTRYIIRGDDEGAFRMLWPSWGRGRGMDVDPFRGIALGGWFA